ncbi:MAG: FkbM family methyltransferase [Bacteroidetes bacterium]|nr:FkbM family methyltransferase [Bacteroidota bacterium]
MKTFIKYILQKLLGFKTYLYVFALFVIVKIRWDKKEKDFFHFLGLIPDGGIVLDLGANIGVTSYHLAKKLPGSTIFSFEPLTLNMNTLKRVKNKFRLKNINEYKVAVGETNGTIEMVMPVINNVPMHGLSHVVHVDNIENNSGLKYKVPVISLDSFEELKETKKRITALKIDVENFEYFVLKGGEKLLQKNRPVIYCELWDNENRKKCISLLNNLGYSAFILNRDELVPIEKTTIEKHNFFFIPDSVTD